MEVFIEFADPDQRDLVLKKSEVLCRIALIDGKLRYWFQPHDHDCYNAFTEWLDDNGIEYENV